MNLGALSMGLTPMLFGRCNDNIFLQTKKGPRKPALSRIDSEPAKRYKLRVCTHLGALGAIDGKQSKFQTLGPSLPLTEKTVSFGL